MNDPRPRPRPRLLVAASTFPSRPGDGTPPFVRDLSLVLARSFDTEVLVPRVPGALAVETSDGMTVRRFAYAPRRWEDLADGAIIENLRARPTRIVQVPAFLVAEAIAMRRRIRTFRPDVLHLHWIIPQGVVALVAARSTPWLVTVHGADLYALSGRAARWLKGRVLRRAELVTVMNVEMRDAAVRLGVAPARVVVVPMGADINGLRELVDNPAREPRRLLFVGRLVEKKGLAVLIDALRALPSDVEWHLDVAGDGPLRASLEASASAAPITFHGQVDRSGLESLLGRAGIVVIPSVRAASGDQDGRPVVVAEALAAGCCVVASALPGLDEVIIDGVNGVLVPPGDVDTLAKELAELLREPDRVRRLGVTGGSDADAISVDVVGDDYAELLATAAEDGRQRRRAATVGSR